MNCPDNITWIRLSLGELPGDQAARFEAHAAQCATCRDRLAGARADHERLADLYGSVLTDPDRDPLLETINLALASSLSAGEADADRPRLIQWGARIMKKRYARVSVAVLAPAACVALAAIVFLGPAGTAAFADVQQALEKVHTVVCRFRAGMVDWSEKEPDSYGRLYLSSTHGTRHDSFVDGRLIGTTFAPLDGPVVSTSDTGVFVIRQPQEPSSAQTPNDPTAWLEDLKRISAERVASAAMVELDGKPALAFDIPTLDSRLLVSPDTLLPLRYEVGQAAVYVADGKAVYDEFEWDRYLPASHFQPPDGENVHELVQPAFTVDGLVESLAFFADCTGGSYPRSLDCDDVAAELARLADCYGEWDDDGEYVARTAQANLYLGTACLFVKKLRQDGADPVYHGTTVTPGHPEAVLVHWRDAEGRRMVVRGDLSVEIQPAAPADR